MYFLTKERKAAQKKEKALTCVVFPLLWKLLRRF